MTSTPAQTARPAPARERETRSTTGTRPLAARARKQAARLGRACAARRRRRLVTLAFLALLLAPLVGLAQPGTARAGAPGPTTQACTRGPTSPVGTLTLLTTGVSGDTHKQLTTASSHKLLAHSSGSRVVWADGRNVNQALDLSKRTLDTNTERPLVTGPGDQILPDTDGNRVVYSGRASSFESICLLTANDPADQLSNLIARVKSIDIKQGIENSRDVTLQNAQAALAAVQAGDVTTACSLLGAFVDEVRAQAGRTLTVGQATQLFKLATKIRGELRC
jgi:hypothetical protein